MLQTASLTSATGSAQPGGGGRPLSGTRFLAILVSCFMVVAAVNATMIYYALATFRGEVDRHPYEHGLAYNKDIAAALAQDARHWLVTEHLGGHGMHRTVRAIFRDGGNRPLSDLAVTAQLQFATDMRRDQAVTLSATAPGIYDATFSAANGQWDLVIEAKRAGKPLFRSRSRITLE